MSSRPSTVEEHAEFRGEVRSEIRRMEVVLTQLRDQVVALGTRDEDFRRWFRPSWDGLEARLRALEQAQARAVLVFGLLGAAAAVVGGVAARVLWGG